MRVTVRTKKLKNGGSSIYLDIYHVGKRKYEFLNLYLSKDKIQNKETKKLAEQIRAKRELELASNEFGFSTSFKKKTNFIQYFEKWISGKKFNSIYDCALIKVKEFAGNNLTFQNIDEIWIEDLKSFY